MRAETGRRFVNGALVLAVVAALSTVGLVSILPPRASAYVPHPGIRIYANADFTAANGVTGGSGTPSDPYIIEGWDIDDPVNSGIWIQGTDAYFVIRDSYVHGAGGGGSVELYQLAHGRVENVTIADGGDLSASYARDVAMVGNNLTQSSGLHFGETDGFEARQNRLDGQYAELEVGWGSHNGTVVGNAIPAAGLSIWSAWNVTVNANSFATGALMAVRSSVGISASGNTFTSGGIEIEGNYLDEWDSHTITPDNLANGRPIYYYKNSTGIDVDGVPVGQLIVANCTGIRAANLNASDTAAGIQVAYSRDVVITGDELSRNDYGLYVDTTTHLTVSNNRFAFNAVQGASLYGVHTGTIDDNVFEGNDGWGLSVSGSNSVDIYGNNISSNQEGMFLGSDDTLTVRDNVVESTVDTGIEGWYLSNASLERNRVSGSRVGVQLAIEAGILLDENWIEDNSIAGASIFVDNGTWTIVATRNTFRANGYGVWLGNNVTGATVSTSIYHNNFESNTVQAFDNAAVSQWDGGYPVGGNYWSDYTGVDACSGPNQNICPPADGLGDTPYAVNVSNEDRYPLMAVVPTIWTNTPPTIRWLAPAGGEVWTGGSTHTLSWQASDAQDPASALTIDLEFSASQGATWAPVVAGLSGNESLYAWVLPASDVPAAILRACVTDSLGAQTCAIGDAFAIDATPPSVVSFQPSEGVQATDPLVVAFSETVNRSSAESAFSLTPSPGGLEFAWNTEGGRDVLTVTHDPFAEGVAYTVTITASLRDRSDPGNHLAAPWSTTFQLAAGDSGVRGWIVPLVVIAAAGGATVVSMTETGRVALFTMLVAAARRRKEDEEEDREVRGMVRGYVLVHPGDTYTDVKRNLDLNNGSATWHLHKLEKDGILKSRLDGTRRRYYPAEMRLHTDNGGLPQIQREVLDHVTKTPGLPVRLLAEELDVSSQLALYHLRKLSQQGLLRLERQAFHLVAYPSQPPTALT